VTTAAARLSCMCPKTRHNSTFIENSLPPAFGRKPCSARIRQANSIPGISGCGVFLKGSGADSSN
jgi:hypothetical protein